jgi:hypothetical protein
MRLFIRMTAALMIIAVFTMSSAAQKFNVSWGDNTRLKYDFEDAVPLSNGQFLILKLKVETKIALFGIGGSVEQQPILVLVDKNMEPVLERDIVIEEKNAFLKGFEKYGANIFFIYGAYDKGSKTTSVYALKVDEKMLKTSGKITLGTYSSDNKYDQAEPSYKISSDSSKVLLFVEGPERKKENKKFFLGVFDTNLKSIWKKEIELPIGEKYVSIYDMDITNEGKVFVAIKHYDKEVARETVREDGAKIPSYAYKILVYDGSTTKGKEITFNLGNQFIQGTKLTFDKNGTITVAGLYKRKHNGNVNGAFYAVFDGATAEVKNPKMAAFPPEMITLVDKDNFGSDKDSDPGLYPGFRIMYIMNRNNGSVDLISEYFRMDIVTEYNPNTGRTTSYPRYNYGDIINTNIDRDGKAVFTRIPKNQKLSYAPIFLGFYPILYKDKLVLLYNDDKDNLERDIEKKPDDISNFKRSVFLAATIDAKGNVSRQSIYSHKDEDYITMPMHIAKISDTKYLIVSDLLKLFKRRTRFGVMEVK